MKASAYEQTGTPEVLKYVDLPDPICSPSQVRIEVKAISLEGGDVLNRGYGEKPNGPFVVGYAAAGVVTEVGANVSTVSVGQRVTTLGGSGSHAEQRVVSPATCWPLPDSVDFEQGACVPVTCGTAHEGIFEFGGLQSDETLLVQGGAGGVGLVAIQLAKEIGATVYATASSDERLANLAAFGLDEGINYEKNDLVVEVMRLTDKQGVQVVLDPVGGRVLEQSIAAAGHRGRIVSVGTASRDFDKVNVAGLAPGNKRLTGVFLGAEITTKRAQAVVKELVNKMAEGKLRVPIAKTFALAEAAKAHEFVESRQAIGRVILVP